MQAYIPTDDQIRSQFVNSLMNYFKIEEDVFLRSHIDELIRPISVTKYSDFLHRLSTRPLSFKTGIEKIALIAQEILSEQRSPLEEEARLRTQKLYDLMYDLRRSITEVKGSLQSALERFENVRFTTLRRSDSNTPLLDAMDIDAIRQVSKRWIYDYVAFDRGLFEARLLHEYTQLLLEQERNLSLQAISARTAQAIGHNRS